MEENNRKGPGIFYAVVGVATLVVAIIGATFAFFSASANAGDGSEDIEGGTNNALANALELNVYKLDWTDKGGAASNDLVPADFGGTTGTAGTPRDLKIQEVQGALNAKCVADGYTGCHLWKIEATAAQTVDEANILLNLSVDADVPDNWRYAVFTATGDTVVGDVTDPKLTVTGFSSVAGAQGTLKTAVTNLDIHNGAKMTQGTVTTDPDTGVITKVDAVSNYYYLLVYLANIESSQNETTSETGTYEGTVTLQAMGGEVKATFQAAQ